MTELIDKYLPALTAVQKRQMALLGELYPEWNAKINVISRKDIGQLYLHHVLHSLSIAELIQFRPGTRVMDAGTGGGFPGIPLAILFPETQFTLVDSIGKKIKVVEAVAEGVELNNVTSLNGRFESVPGEFDFITGRAVSNLALFVSMLSRKVKKKNSNQIPNGILYLTGGDAVQELAGIRAKTAEYSIHNYFPEEYFATKKLVHIHSFRY
jgi:16S rRNA (guanine527-N7)-methyltransferase